MDVIFGIVVVTLMEIEVFSLTRVCGLLDRIKVIYPGLCELHVGTFLQDSLLSFQMSIHVKL